MKKNKKNLIKVLVIINRFGLQTLEEHLFLKIWNRSGLEF